MTDSPLLNTPATIDPYRQAAGQLLRRIRWDLTPASWSSRKRLRAIRDQQRGKAVILCNGPSLLKSPLELLDGTYCFGLNKINLLFEQSSFRPSCIVAVNELVLEQNAPYYNETELPLFLDSSAAAFVESRPNVTFLHSDFRSNSKFARDCSLSINPGGTVTYVALQLAYHMGFEQVALIGCDHNFASKGPANAAVESGDKDPDHFAPNYFAGGVKWQLPDLPLSEYSYSLARDVFAGSGRALYNATVGGKLEILPRVDLAEFLALP